MKEISNSTLAMLVVLAITVSVFSTLVSLNRLNVLGGGVGLTGFATTDIGIANVTVSATASINLTDRSVDLGTVTVMFSNDSDVRNDYFMLKNIGGVNVSIVAFSAAQAEDGRGAFTTTSDSGGCIDPNPDRCFEIKCNSSRTGFDCNDTYYVLYDTTGEAQDLVWDLSYVEGNDTATFGVNATVPPGEGAGLRSLGITFEAASSE
jgi:hypothetical protein